MRTYLDIVKHVLDNGKEKKPVRKNTQTGKWEPVDGGISTLACANVLFSHDMSRGFPLLTTKKMAWKTIRVELEGFIKGITDKKWYQERGCKIWNEWANPSLVHNETLIRWRYECQAEGKDLSDPPWEFRKKVMRELTDLGPIYGYQWRRFDEHYDTDESNAADTFKEGPNGVWHGTDQLKNIVDTLLTNPMDRRMVCSAWNPNQIHMMALPPCHYSWNVTVIGDELNLFWAQRSCDLMLGVPFNIASYALLLELLAYTANLKVGNLSGMLVDCHIYENQIEAAKQQIQREPRDLPFVTFRNHSGKLRKAFHILDWTYEDVELLNYDPLPQLDFGEVAV